MYIEWINNNNIRQIIFKTSAFSGEKYNTKKCNVKGNVNTNVNTNVKIFLGELIS